MKVKKSSWHYKLAANWSDLHSNTYEPAKTRLSYYKDILQGVFNIAALIIMLALFVFISCFIAGVIPAMLLGVESTFILRVIGASIIVFAGICYFLIYRVVYACKWLQEEVKIIK